MSETHRSKTFVSARQVAERAGVSRSAVSRTFTEGASVSAGTRRRVLEAAEALGYHVNHLARGLMHRESGIVCLIVADVDTPYLASMVKALTQGLQDAGKVAMVLNTSGGAENVEAALRRTLHYRADATVVLSGTPAQSIIRTCIDNGQHVILINRDDRLVGPDNVVLDHALAARAAFAAFLRAGCRRMAVITSEAGTPSLLARERAFAEAARQAGVPVAVWRQGRTGYAAGGRGARALLGERERPDAAFCVSDLLACGFMDAARLEFGLRIPEDLCVVGFDDIEQAGWTSYGLTTFRQPIEPMVAAITALVMRTGPRPAGEKLVFEAPMVWRQTVRGELGR